MGAFPSKRLAFWAKRPEFPIKNGVAAGGFEPPREKNLHKKLPIPVNGRAFRGRVAAPTLTSGWQPVTFQLDTMKKPFCGTAGSRTPRRSCTDESIDKYKALM